MATFCTVGDVRAALAPGGDQADTSTAASLPDWQIEDSIDEAEDTIRAYTQAYNIVPMEITVSDPENPTNTPPFMVAPNPIRRWTRDIAAYLATLVFRRGKDLPEDDPIRLRYTRVMSLLADVRSDANILDLPPVAGSSGSRVEIFNLYEGTLFGPEDMALTASSQDVQRIWRAELWDV